LTLLTSLLLL
jgi:histone-binding protein RBBP4